MNNKLQKQLMEKYPKIFPDASPETKDEPVHCWGIECKDGWYKILDSACDLIQRHIDASYGKVNQVIACQIKQKMGGLRFYYDGGDDIVDGIVRTVQYMSYDICEECGSNKNISTTKGSIKTLCQECKGGGGHK